MYCLYCYLCRTVDQGYLIDSALSDWRNMNLWMQCRVGEGPNSHHNGAVQRAEAFLSVASGRQEDVVHQIYSNVARRAERNRASMKTILQCVLFCGRHNIAFRGHTENLSNFIGLVHFRAETDSVLKDHLQILPEMPGTFLLRFKMRLVTSKYTLPVITDIH